MTFGLYRVELWGPEIAGTASNPQWVTLSGVAKRNSVKAAYAVANEFICGRLALMLGLPVPPGVVVQALDGSPVYVALRFGKQNELPPPVIPQHVVEDEPWFSAGIITFDMWTANFDRHAGNLAYVRGGAPLVVFDHSHALLGDCAGEAVEWLRAILSQSCVAGSGCLTPELTDGTNLLPWATRIASLPDDVIRNVCQLAVTPNGLTSIESLAVGDFLCARKSRIVEFLERDRESFVKIKDWSLQ